MLAHDSGIDLDDVRPFQAAGQEGADGLLVGGVEDGRVSRGGRHRAAGEVNGREGLGVQRLEGPGGRLIPLVGGDQSGQVGPRRPGQAQGDRQAHVRGRCLGDGGAVDELHHGVDDRLRVDDDGDVGRVDVEQEVRLDQLQPLVDQSRGVDGDDGPHRPGRVRQGLLGGHPGQLGARAPAEGTARGGEDQAAHVAAPGDRRAGQSPLVAAGGQGLGDGGVLGIYRDDLAGSARGAPDQRSPHDEGLLVRQRQARTGGQRRQGGPQAHRTGDSVDDGVLLGQLRPGDELDRGVRADKDLRHRIGAAQTVGRRPQRGAHACRDSRLG